MIVPAEASAQHRAVPRPAPRPVVYYLRAAVAVPTVTVRTPTARRSASVLGGYAGWYGWYAWRVSDRLRISLPLRRTPIPIRRLLRLQRPARLAGQAPACRGLHRRLLRRHGRRLRRLVAAAHVAPGEHELTDLSAGPSHLPAESPVPTRRHDQVEHVMQPLAPGEPEEARRRRRTRRPAPVRRDDDLPEPPPRPPQPSRAPHAAGPDRRAVARTTAARDSRPAARCGSHRRRRTLGITGGRRRDAAAVGRHAPRRGAEGRLPHLQRRGPGAARRHDVAQRELEPSMSRLYRQLPTSNSQLPKDVRTTGVEVAAADPVPFDFHLLLRLTARWKLGVGRWELTMSRELTAPAAPAAGTRTSPRRRR